MIGEMGNGYWVDKKSVLRTDTVIIKFDGKFPKRYCHEIRKLIISYTYFSVFIGTFRAIGRF